ncbi:3'-phosphoadenosine 5'-phosphosulfate sulfotransferase [Salmonella bongori]|nr:3'-phosphoadenosine 5'-phosphosulfate sulfotransferase [Salmonella bongori]
MYKENITESDILASLDELIGRWAKEREAGEGFGDFTVRAGIVRPVLESRAGFLGITPDGVMRPGINVGLISVAPSGKTNSEESMAKLSLSALNERPKVDRVLALAETNAALETLSAEERIVWALENLPGEYVLSSSFGIQAAVSLHLVNQVYPRHSGDSDRYGLFVC